MDSILESDLLPTTVPIRKTKPPLPPAPGVERTRGTGRGSRREGTRPPGYSHRRPQSTGGGRRDRHSRLRSDPRRLGDRGDQDLRHEPSTRRASPAEPASTPRTRRRSPGFQRPSSHRGARRRPHLPTAAARDVRRPLTRTVGLGSTAGRMGRIRPGWIPQVGRRERTSPPTGRFKRHLSAGLLSPDSFSPSTSRSTEVGRS